METCPTCNHFKDGECNCPLPAGYAKKAVQLVGGKLIRGTEAYDKCPAWSARLYRRNHCPRCGSKNIDVWEDTEEMRCKDCYELSSLYAAFPFLQEEGES